MEFLRAKSNKKNLKIVARGKKYGHHVTIDNKWETMLQYSLVLSAVSAMRHPTVKKILFELA